LFLCKMVTLRPFSIACGSPHTTPALRCAALRYRQQRTLPAVPPATSTLLLRAAARGCGCGTAATRHYPSCCSSCIRVFIHLLPASCAVYLYLIYPSAFTACSRAVPACGGERGWRNRRHLAWLGGEGAARTFNGCRAAAGIPAAATSRAEPATLVSCRWANIPT